MADVIVSNVSDIKLDVLSEGEISLTLADVPDINVQFEVTQGPSGPKGDTGDISPELQALADAASVSATQAAASAATASQIVLGQATGLPNVLPTLNLDFANSKILDNRVTFTRASTATYYDGKTVAKAEENLLIRSQEFDNASWIKTQATVTANAGVSPDGFTTADKLIDNTTNTRHFVSQAVNTVSGSVYVLSVFAKAVERNVVRVQAVNGGAPVGTFANFNLSTGAVGTVGTGTTAAIIDVGNGWYRCQITFTATSSASTTFIYNVTLSDTDSQFFEYTGDGTSGIYIWGAQLEQRSTITAYTPTTTQPITNYVPVLLTAPTNSPRFDHDPVTGESLGLLIEEQRTNLLLYSEQFDHAVWSKSNATVTPNAVVAPDGTLTADKLVEDATVNSHSVVRTVLTAVVGTSYTFTCYVKAAERGFAFVGINGGGNVAFATVNLTSGGVSVANGTPTVSGASAGNGWWRVVVTATATTATSLSVDVRTSTDGVWANRSYQGDGYSGIYIWGAQLETGAFPTSYIKTEASQVTRSQDRATMTGTNFSSWFNPDQGTAYTETRILTVSSNANTSFGITGTTINDRLIFGQYFTTYRVLGVGVNNVDQVILGAPAPSVGVTNKSVGAYKVNDFAGSLNGATALTDTSGTVPFVSRAEIGVLLGATQVLNGHIKRITYWPKRLTNSELQALTAQ